MNKETIARHLGVKSGQIVSARPEDEGYRVLVDYGIGGIKVLHVEVAEEPEVPEVPEVKLPAKASSPEAGVVVADEPADKPKPAKASNPPGARAKAKR